MEFVTVKSVLWLASFFPWLAAWRCNRRLSIAHALVWALLTWGAWGVVLIGDSSGHQTVLALCLTGCAGVAVLGGRRPHVGAWNFVVLGLLAVMILPLVEGWILKARTLDGLRQCFLAGTLALGIGNYLPTRLGWGALSLGLGCAILLVELFGWVVDPVIHELALYAIPLSPWLAWIPFYIARGKLEKMDAAWRNFRDRMGFVWGQRVMDQFNTAAKNQGLPAVLTWGGLKKGEDWPPAAQAGAEQIMRGLLGRFGPAD